jgi:propanol-preferring alcohol dehydrogenase
VEPPEPGPGEVLVAIGGAGLCHSDLHVTKDFPAGSLPWTFPFTLGHENAGWVRAVGQGVHGLDVGQPVAVYGSAGCGRCRNCARGAENYCLSLPTGAPVPGLGADGGMADVMLVGSDRFLVPLPDGLSPVQAAPLTDAALTPYHAITAARHLLVPGASAAVIGVGGLGHLAVQILRATTDVQVIAVDTRPAALELAAESGADVVMNPDGAADAIRDASGGEGARAVFDFVASDQTLRLAAGAVSVDGWIGIVGIGAGSLPVSLLGLPFGVTVRPTYWGTRPELLEVLALAARGDLTAKVTTYPLSQAPQAYADLSQGSVIGRCVVVPDEAAGS